MTLGEHIRTARTELGLSIRDVAATIGVAHSAVHGWELGRIHIPFYRLPTICSVLKISYESVARPLWLEEQAARDHETLARAEQRLAARRNA